jgi:hypothetical protein
LKTVYNFSIQLPFLFLWQITVINVKCISYKYLKLQLLQCLKNTCKNRLNKAYKYL